MFEYFSLFKVIALGVFILNLLSCQAEQDEWSINNGVIIKRGQPYDVRCANWNGLEGHDSDLEEGVGAKNGAMELYAGNMWWLDSGRTVQQTMLELKQQGINTIRLPIAPQTLDATNPDGKGRVSDGGRLNNHPDISQDNARKALEDFILLADKNSIAVLINLHSCSNHILWQAGGFDFDPGIDPGFGGQDDASCNDGEDEYSESLWLDNLKDIAQLPQQLGVNNIIGIDIFNEPWSFSWSEWKALSDKAYIAINAVNPDMLIWVEGTSSSPANGKGNPHGSEETIPSLGENFFEFKAQPLNIPRNRLVLSPHTYGPSAYVKKQFLHKECTGLAADEASKNECEVVITPAKLEAGWEEHFGYLKESGYAIVVGEFGGNMDWPLEYGVNSPNGSWAHVTPGVDEQWQNTLVDYMVKKDIEGCYSSVNPEASGDVNVGGLYEHRYTPGNPESWGSWGELDLDKFNLLKRLWGAN